MSIVCSTISAKEFTIDYFCMRDFSRAQFRAHVEYARTFPGRLSPSPSSPILGLTVSQVSGSGSWPEGVCAAERARDRNQHQRMRMLKQDQNDQ